MSNLAREITPARRIAQAPVRPLDREKLHAEIRALLGDPVVADAVRAGLAGDGTGRATTDVPKWVADFLRGEGGALAHVLPRLIRRHGLKRRDHHGL
jgi:hypothetical protein